MAKPLIAIVGSVDATRSDYDPPLRNVTLARYKHHTTFENNRNCPVKLAGQLRYAVRSIRDGRE
jgi:hypothetical protein